MLDFFNILAQCGPFNEREFEFVSIAYKSILLIVPAIVIVLCTIDIASAVVAQDDNGIKTAQNKALKRIIAGAIVFFIPVLLNIFLGINYKVTNSKGETENLSLGRECVEKVSK